MSSLAGMDLGMWLLWLGLAAFTLGMVVLMWTRWGQYRPLSKCLMLSVLAHALMAGYAANVEILGKPDLPVGSPVMQVGLDEGPGQWPGGSGQATSGDASQGKPWESLVHDPAAAPPLADPQRQDATPPMEIKRQAVSPGASLLGAPSLDHLATGPTAPLEPEQPALAKAAEPRLAPVEAVAEIDVPQAQERKTPAPAGPDDQPLARRDAPSDAPESSLKKSAGENPPGSLQAIPSLPQVTETGRDTEAVGALATVPDTLTSSGGSGSGSSFDAGYSGVSTATSGIAAVAGQSPRIPAPVGAVLSGGAEGAGLVPGAYQLRTAPNRGQIAAQHGGSPQTEAAVRAALKWLAENQGADGQWIARQHGAGQERLVLGRNRHNAGIEADTGVTGLALLAFLASGHTHRQGDYHDNVRRGLEFLLAIQAADGNLSGQADTFARMYCHAMAAFAMSEDYGMTRDSRLHEPVRRAVGYTLAAQHPTTGGWRYRPADPGDTSQFGWQLMVLKSAELAGIPIPETTRQGMLRYLNSVASGNHGGLASYRPGEQISRTMTAEALVCWQFLGLARDHPAASEAAEYLAGQLPGDGGKPNLYYWYYGTLAMYQWQGPHWPRWNEALQTALVKSQRTTGSLAGSWDTDTVWGGYGGRVYTTAMAALCLEVYYRYLPLYARATPMPR